MTTAVLMGAMLPWTLVVIMPTNDALRFKKELSDSEVQHLCLLYDCVSHPPVCSYLC